jgi:L-asparaginase II
MLTLARFLGATVEGYARPEHPVQNRIRAALSATTGVAVDSMTAVTDGCGVPTIALPLVALARAIAGFATGDLAAPWAKAAARLVAAMTGHPIMVAGQGRFDTDVITATGGGVLAKGGAEGVQVAAIRATGLGFAVKIDDGAGRAAEVLMATLLNKFGGFDAGAGAALHDRLAAKIHSRAGAVVGELRVSL